ncbi:MAG: hypothetical protein ABIH99_00785 [Candidatus Micrarchaeota archaeon]
MVQAEVSQEERMRKQQQALEAQKHQPKIVRLMDVGDKSKVGVKLHINSEGSSKSIAKEAEKKGRSVDMFADFVIKEQEKQKPKENESGIEPAVEHIESQRKQDIEEAKAKAASQEGRKVEEGAKTVVQDKTKRSFSQREIKAAETAISRMDATKKEDTRESIEKWAVRNRDQNLAKMAVDAKGNEQKTDQLILYVWLNRPNLLKELAPEFFNKINEAVNQELKTIMQEKDADKAKNSTIEAQKKAGEDRVEEIFERREEDKRKTMEGTEELGAEYKKK